MKLLDLTGLSYFFSKVKTYVDKVIDEERQENGVKSAGRYIQINAEGRRSDDAPRNTRIVSKEGLLAIKDYIDKLEVKYPNQYQFSGAFVVSESSTLTDI